jgi:hypothetical protein
MECQNKTPRVVKRSRSGVVSGLEDLGLCPVCGGHWPWLCGDELQCIECGTVLAVVVPPQRKAKAIAPPAPTKEYRGLFESLGLDPHS